MRPGKKHNHYPERKQLERSTKHNKARVTHPDGLGEPRARHHELCIVSASPALTQKTEITSRLFSTQKKAVGYHNCLIESQGCTGDSCFLTHLRQVLPVTCILQHIIAPFHILEIDFLHLP